MLLDFDPNQITDMDGARQAIRLLPNLVEELKSENDALRQEVQPLRDEINRLRGEQDRVNHPLNPAKSSRPLTIAWKRNGTGSGNGTRGAKSPNAKLTGKKP